MKKIAQLLLVVSLSLATGCLCGPRVKKAYKVEVDKMLAKHSAQTRTVPAPNRILPQQWKVGQWTMYKTDDGDGDIGYDHLSVVKKDDCGFWVQSVKQTYKTGRSVSQICYERMPFKTNPNEAVDDALDLVRVMKTKSEDNPIQTIDFRTPQGAGMKTMMSAMATTIHFDWTIHDGLPRDDVTVPAATFKQAAKLAGDVSVAFIKIHVTSWVHPRVPVNGSVRTQSKRYSSELLDYGQTGAADALE